MAIENALASVAVKDIDSAVKWYERILNRPPSRPMAEVAEWSFEGGGSLQVYRLLERAGSGSFTLIVTDIAEQIAQLDNLAIDTRERTSSDRVRTVMITDLEATILHSPSPSISAWPADGICRNVGRTRGVIKARSTGRHQRVQFVQLASTN